LAILLFFFLFSFPPFFIGRSLGLLAFLLPGGGMMSEVSLPPFFLSQKTPCSFFFSRSGYYWGGLKVRLCGDKLFFFSSFPPFFSSLFFGLSGIPQQDRFDGFFFSLSSAGRRGVSPNHQGPFFFSFFSPFSYQREYIGGKPILSLFFPAFAVAVGALFFFFFFGALLAGGTKCPPPFNPRVGLLSPLFLLFPFFFFAF